MSLSYSIALPEQAEIICLLLNSAYRGDSSRLGWTTEADLLGGQRADPEMIREILQSPMDTLILAYDSDSDNQLVGCIRVERTAGSICHFGMLTIRPTLQNRGYGDLLLKEGEPWARSENFKEMSLTVLAPRRELIDWYSRRNYRLTGERRPFPYGDLRFGQPLRDDLVFLVMKKVL